MKAHDVMTWGAITVEPDASVTRAVRLMLQNKISGLPVIDAKGQLVDRLAGWWRLRSGPRATASDSVRVADDGEAAARGPGTIESKPRIVPGKWPGAANPHG